MRRTISSFFLFLTASVAVTEQAVSSNAPAQNAAPAIDESLNGSQYVNKTAKFSLSLPSDWIINKVVRHSPSTLAWLSTPDNKNWVGVTKDPVTGSLEDFKQAYELKARSNLTNYQKLSESSVTIDGKAALLISYRAAVPQNANVHVAYLVALVPSGNTYSAVMAWCAEPRFNDMRPIFEKILASYRGTEQTSAAVPPSKP